MLLAPRTGTCNVFSGSGAPQQGSGACSSGAGLGGPVLGTGWDPGEWEQVLFGISEMASGGNGAQASPDLLHFQGKPQIY